MSRGLTYIFRMALLVGLSAGVALLWNGFSTKGIPLVGQWDTEVGVVTPAPAEDEAALTIQTVEEARALWEKGAVFVDARKAESYWEGHIKGAVSLSVYEFDAQFFDFLDAYPPDTALVVYCSGRLCDESHRLAEMLEQEGYANVRIFADGIPAWAAAGLPVKEEE